MDNRKNSHQQPKDFEKIFSENEKYGLILDANHIYTNDKLMKLADEFYDKFGDQIVQLHVSGYIDYHDPIFRTKQLPILKAIQNLHTPIIIESVLAVDDLEKERNYILDFLSDITKTVAY